MLDLIVGVATITIVIWFVSIFVRVHNLYKSYKISPFSELDSAQLLQVKKLEKEMPNFNRLCIVMILFAICVGVTRVPDKKKMLEKTAVEKTREEVCMKARMVKDE